MGQPAVEESMRKRGYVPHVRQREEEVEEKERKKISPYVPAAGLWNRAHSSLNRFRKLLVRFEKTAASYDGLLELACALITFRQVIIIHG